MRGEAVAQHDLSHASPIRWPAARCVDHRGCIAEKLRSNRRRRHQTEYRRVPGGVVIELVNRASGNAERLSWSDVDWVTIHGPGQHAFYAVDRFLETIVAVRRSRKALCARNHNVKSSDGASRVQPREQETHGERPEVNRFVGRIDAQIDRW